MTRRTGVERRRKGSRKKLEKGEKRRSPFALEMIAAMAAMGER
jgi:hypothetical protein